MVNVLKQEEEHIREIVDFIKRLKRDGLSCAVWGAGKRGAEFCKCVDKDCTLISYIFDKDLGKVGNRLPTGHMVVDYHEYAQHMAYVFVVMPSFEADTISLLKEIGYKGNIINADNWILGGMTPEAQAGMLAPQMKKVRDVRMAALVILYEPNKKVADYIATYANDVEKVYVWDNSETSHKYMFDDTDYSNHIQFLHDGENYGLGYPVNVVAKMAADEKIDWLITFDQDSCAGEGMIRRMRDYAESDVLDPLAAVISPVFFEVQPASFLTYMRSTIQSGAMHNVDMLLKLRYREELFIDQMDMDYCERARHAGYRIVRVNGAILNHQQDDKNLKIRSFDGVVFYEGKYSTARYYYQCRNLLYSIKWFRKIDADYVRLCLRWLRTLKVMAVHDVNKDEHLRALECAYRDAAAGVMGKWMGE